MRWVGKNFKEMEHIDIAHILIIFFCFFWSLKFTDRRQGLYNLEAPKSCVVNNFKWLRGSKYMYTHIHTYENILSNQLKPYKACARTCWYEYTHTCVCICIKVGQKVKWMRLARLLLLGLCLQAYVCRIKKQKKKTRVKCKPKRMCIHMHIHVLPYVVN